MIARAEEAATSLEPDGSKMWERISEIQGHIRAERLDVAIDLIGKIAENLAAQSSRLSIAPPLPEGVRSGPRGWRPF